MDLKLRILLIATALCFGGCANTNVASYDALPDTVAAPKDEQKLWAKSKDLQRRLELAEVLYEEPELQKELQRIIDTLAVNTANIPDPGPRVYMVESTSRNAFALPHGAIYFNLGLLAGLENEAEFAVVAGHELSHYIHRHGLRSSRNRANSSMQSAAIGLAGILIGGVIAGEAGARLMGQLSSNVVEHWHWTAVSGYSQELEQDADTFGLQMVIDAGYDASVAPGVFERLKDNSANDESESFYSTHPRMEERRRHYQDIVNEYDFSNAHRGTGKSDFIANLAQARRATAGIYLANYEYDEAEKIIAVLILENPDSGQALFLDAVLQHLTGKPDAELIQLWKAATTADNPNPLAWKELGFALRTAGKMEQASSAFERYLQLEPDAVERPVLIRYINESKATPQ